MSFLRKNFDFAILGLVAGGFLLVATQRLGAAPVPDTDESYMLQTSYEMLYRGKLALPFRRYLGGDIENNWHSFTPLHYMIQSGFLKLFGWGLLQGRVFNLITAMLTLLMAYLIGRKLFGWAAGLVAALMLVCDVTFLERSRHLRNDYSAAMFALLAFYLYEEAERRNSWRLFFGSGLAAGAALMSHTSAAYMLAAIALLMSLRRGWQVIKARAVYQFAVGVFIVSAYEIFSCIFDYGNVLLQNRGDKVHFSVLGGGLWKNVRHEPRRYYKWFAGDLMYPDVPRTLLHLFQALAAIALAYLIIRLVIYLRRGNAIAEPRMRVLAVVVIAMLFFATVAGRKAIYYMAHLAPWYALMAGILVADALGLLKRLRDGRVNQWRAPKFAYAAAVGLVAVLAVGFAYQVFKQNKRYLKAVRDPDLASFEQFKAAMRSLVPEGVCPVAVREPVMWLAFPEHDRCFANIQERMKKAVDIDGNEYALIVSPRHARYWLRQIASGHHYLLGELMDTPYGNYQVYYTGVDPRWLERRPVRYQFFGRRRGYASDEQIALAREVWAAGPAELRQCAGLASSAIEPDGLVVGSLQRGVRADGFIKLCEIELGPNTIYQMKVETGVETDQWALVALEGDTGAWLGRRGLAETENLGEGLFKTGKINRVIIGLLPAAKDSVEPPRISRLSIREVGPVNR
ncbi:MAG TPA: glycosyltransferase family 39 protein [Blastocatellia bacterium]|nr:glycosyltransferase family 39 protein [Blastocatellia bacterium]